MTLKSKIKFKNRFLGLENVQKVVLHDDVVQIAAEIR